MEEKVTKKVVRNVVKVNPTAKDLYAGAFDKAGNGIPLKVDGSFVLNHNVTMRIPVGLSVTIPDGCIGLVIPEEARADMSVIPVFPESPILITGKHDNITIRIYNPWSAILRLSRGDVLARLVIMKIKDFAFEQEV